MHVVRELTENRSKLVCARTNLAEKLAEMQHEYMRLMRVADLSRVVSKENVAKTAKVMKTLKQVSCWDPLCSIYPLVCSNPPLPPPPYQGGHSIPSALGCLFIQVSLHVGLSEDSICDSLHVQTRAQNMAYAASLQPARIVTTSNGWVLCSTGRG